MIIVKFQSGALGNFLSCVLHKEIKPVAKIDYGRIEEGKILHTGSYEGPQDKRFQRALASYDFPVMSHNNPVFESYVKNLSDTKNIFIDLDSNFVEYRLNYIYKMPDWNKMLNDCAITKSWKHFDRPVAYDNARRIVRLHQNKEQQIKMCVDKDLSFSFENFYIKDETHWINTFKKLCEQVEVEITKDELSDWFRCFNDGQSPIIKRAGVLYDCISKRKFVDDLSEEEKGIVIGYDSVSANKDDATYFQRCYETFS